MNSIVEIPYTVTVEMTFNEEHPLKDIKKQFKSRLFESFPSGDHEKLGNIYVSEATEQR